MNGLEHIRDMLGDEKQSKISDAEIKDTLYHYYFDIDQSVSWLLGQYAARALSRFICQYFPQRRGNAGWWHRRRKVSVPELRLVFFLLPLSVLPFLYILGVMDWYPCYWSCCGSEKVHLPSYLERPIQRCADPSRPWSVDDPDDPEGKPLPIPPPEDYGDWSPPSDSASGRHNVPFVRLTQSDYVSSSEQESVHTSTRPRSLYTITEMTERTEDSRDWDPPPMAMGYHGHVGGSRATNLSSISTDYGQVIGEWAEL